VLTHKLCYHENKIEIISLKKETRTKVWILISNKSNENIITLQKKKTKLNLLKKDKKKSLAFKTEKKKQVNPCKPLKPGLISKTYKPWNHWTWFNQEA
jgi:hypothetical protein